MGKIARFAVAALLLIAACADDEFAPPPPPIDAPNGCGDCDAPNDAPDLDAAIDAIPIDARIDAASTVTVVQCPGNADVTITIVSGPSGTAFSPSTATLAVNGVVKFDPAGTSHNMTSGTGGVPDGNFATPTSQVACLRFTAAGSFPYYCSVHGFSGTITVN